MPRLNKEAIALAIKLGLACNCDIVQHNYFARKNYFYADLPKGYQISQHTTPICKNGFVDIAAEKESKRIRLNRINIEEDAGKSMHDENSDYSNLDFNRAGMPLLEIVSEPDLRSAEEAFASVTSLRKLVRQLGVCDGNMEQGSLRCDVNISVRKKGEQKRYFHHTGYMGHERFTPYGTMIAKHPERVIEKAVYGMLPKNALGRQVLRRKLRVYANAEHPHVAQTPTALSFDKSEK